MEKIKEYGKIGIITHLSLSWTFLLFTYLSVKHTPYTTKIVKYFKLQNKIPPKASALIVSGIIYKATMPLRLVVSAMAIPLVVKALGDNDQQSTKSQTQ